MTTKQCNLLLLLGLHLLLGSLTNLSWAAQASDRLSTANNKSKRHSMYLVPLEYDSRGRSLWSTALVVRQRITAHLPISPVAKAPAQPCRSSGRPLERALQELLALAQQATVSSPSRSSSSAIADTASDRGSQALSLGMDYFPAGSRLIVPPSSDDGFLADSDTDSEIESLASAVSHSRASSISRQSPISTASGIGSTLLPWQLHGGASFVYISVQADADRGARRWVAHQEFPDGTRRSRELDTISDR